MWIGERGNNSIISKSHEVSAWVNIPILFFHEELCSSLSGEGFVSFQVHSDRRGYIAGAYQEGG